MTNLRRAWIVAIVLAAVSFFLRIYLTEQAVTAVGPQGNTVYCGLGEYTSVVAGWTPNCGPAMANQHTLIMLATAVAILLAVVAVVLYVMDVGAQRQRRWRERWQGPGPW